LPSVPVWPQRQQPTATPFPQMLGEAWSLIPLEIDLPNHAKRRVLLNPLFAPLRVRRELCIANELWLATLPGRGIKCGGWVAPREPPKASTSKKIVRKLKIAI
jgi:hypothetical protein